MSASRREPSVVAEDFAVNDTGAEAQPGTAELVTLEKYRALGGESHRVLRCLETILASDRYEIVDTGQIARFLGIRSQAVSRALKVLVDKSLIERGPRIGRSHSFRRLEHSPAAAEEDGIARLHAEDTDAVEQVGRLLAANDPAGDAGAVRRYLKFGMVLCYLHDGRIAGVALIDYNPVIDSGPTVAHVIVDRQLRSLGHGRRFLAQIERHFRGKRIFAHAPVGHKDLIITLLKHGFDIVGQQETDGDMALILKKAAGF